MKKLSVLISLLKVMNNLMRLQKNASGMRV